MTNLLHRSDQAPFRTLDGSTVLELVHPGSSSAANQSLAEATVDPGAETHEHLHRSSEEIYCFISGSGRMRLGSEDFEVRAGDSVVIAPGTPHKLWNSSREPLQLLCCCAPPYSDEDTELLE
jgi:mannose-6-phosphate isomerase-like protein (cupin superfamily)